MPYPPRLVVGRGFEGGVQIYRSNLAEEIQFLEFLLIQLCCGNGYKDFIILVSVHITVIAFMGCIFTCFRLVKIPCPLTRVIRYIYCC